MKGFLDNFYNIDTLRGALVSDQASWNLAVTASAILAGPTSCRAADQSSTSRRPGGRTRRQRPVFRAADPAARVAITILTMTREKDISLHMKDGHV
jgi:hypothetical protein